MEFLIPFALEFYRVTLKTYPGLTLLISILFLLVGGIYYFMLKIFPTKAKIFMAPFIVKEQMDNADEYLEEIENDMLSIYLKLRKEAKGCNRGLLLDPETKRFQVMSKLIVFRAKNLIRYFFRENHLLEMDEHEFKEHVSDRADLIMRRLRELYNMWYICGEIPSAEEFYDVFLNDYRHKMRVKLMDMFRDGRFIAARFADKKYVKKYFEDR
jgi:hypothetical protein